MICHQIGVATIKYKVDFFFFKGKGKILSPNKKPQNVLNRYGGGLSKPGEYVGLLVAQVV